MKICTNYKFSTNKLPDQETQNEMVLGHVLRMPQDHIARVARRWIPTRKRSKGRPKITRRRSIIAELSDMGLTMGETQVIVQDRKKWRHCGPHGDEEDKYRTTTTPSIDKHKHKHIDMTVWLHF